MKPCTRSILPIFAALLAIAPSAALAHPGHDGDHGGLSWDFAAELGHYLTSPYHILPVVILGAVAVLGWRYFRSARKDTKR